MTFDSKANLEKTRKLVGYVEKKDAGSETYAGLGFRCGLEIHQQLKTDRKLFCRCPARIYQDSDDFDAQVVRHMRPTLSELGEYDGTALMEFKTRKNVYYRIKNRTACTYEIDDTPPFNLDEESLRIAIEIALLLKTSIVGELHITRKQYLDGSIPTGFQRTGIVGIEGQIPLKDKQIRIMQLSLEEDACREVSDIGHDRVYLTDRLGMPLVETVTYPDMKTPDEAAEAAQYLRFLSRSTGHVRTGIGAARQDVNVSITGGQRVEIKGVPRIKQIPMLTHNEAFRQKSLLEIKKILLKRVKDPKGWKMQTLELPPEALPVPLFEFGADSYRILAVNLPEFKGLLSFFTQPGQDFSDEIHHRLGVIACLGKPAMTHSEALFPLMDNSRLDKIRKRLNSGPNDAQVIVWGPEEDMKTARETIEERCLLAFEGVPNETRKALSDGTTSFERVLPGPDRMYPDTDSPPISILDNLIEAIGKQLPSDVSARITRLEKWKIPQGSRLFILKENRFPLLERIINDFDEPPASAGCLIGQTLKHLLGRVPEKKHPDDRRIYDLFRFRKEKKLSRDILKPLLARAVENPQMDFETILSRMGYRKFSESDMVRRIAPLKEKFEKNRTSKDPGARARWIMGQLRPLALGNMDLKRLRHMIDGDPDE